MLLTASCRSVDLLSQTLCSSYIQSRLTYLGPRLQVVELKDADVEGVAKVDSEEWQSDPGCALKPIVPIWGPCTASTHGHTSDIWMHLQ